MELQSVDLVFNYKDGKRKVTIKACVSEDGYQQWGATTAELGQNVDLLSRLTDAIAARCE